MYIIIRQKSVYCVKHLHSVYGVVSPSPPILFPPAWDSEVQDWPRPHVGRQYLVTGPVWQTAGVGQGICVHPHTHCVMHLHVIYSPTPTTFPNIRTTYIQRVQCLCSAHIDVYFLNLNLQKTTFWVVDVQLIVFSMCGGCCSTVRKEMATNARILTRTTNSLKASTFSMQHRSVFLHILNHGGILLSPISLLLTCMYRVELVIWPFSFGLQWNIFLHLHIYILNI